MILLILHACEFLFFFVNGRMFRLALKHGFCEKIKTRRRRVEVNTVYFCSLVVQFLFMRIALSFQGQTTFSHR